MKPKLSGRGSLSHIDNPFEARRYEQDREFLESEHRAGENPLADTRTTTTFVQAKSIVNAVKSPDLAFNWSLNPYQGCEHGCSYCYARNSHNYWALDAGLDFERKLLVKENAPALLAKFFEKPSWKPEGILMSGNTDCYQAIERKFEISRKLLQVFWEYRNPVGIITKNSLIERDLQLLVDLASKGLCHVAISINTLDEELRRRMEPRTASIKRRFETVKRLSEAGVPVSVMMAPIIPGLNSHDVLGIAEKAATAGARNISYGILRLNGSLPEIFMPWLQANYPNHSSKLELALRDMHGGNLNDSQFGRRMKGSGEWAQTIQQQVNLARRKFFPNAEKLKFETQHFRRLKKGQFSLFDGAEE